MTELRKIKLGNIEQTISIKGDRRNPIVLYLHGGPGVAQIAYAAKYQKDWEKDFFVVNWDQRGAGLSYSETLKSSDMTIEKMVEDVLELTEYLIKEFNQKKIYLVGHSWGTILGLEAVKQNPKLFYAFVSVGQVVNSKKAEKVSLELVLKKAIEKNDLTAIKELSIAEDNQIVEKWAMELGGIFHNIEEVSYLFEPPHSLGVYKEEDTDKWSKGMGFSQEMLHSSLKEINFEESAKVIETPIYFIAGKYDCCTPSSLIKDYSETIEAPYIEYIEFQNSAHGIIFEEPDLFKDVLVSIKEKWKV